jgi:hypothetical protein
MLQNAYLDVKIGVDTAENEPSKVDLIFFDFHITQRFNFHMVFSPLFLALLQFFFAERMKIRSFLAANILRKQE